MSLSGDWHDDMERFALDPDTADRLLSGALGPEDAPHRYGEVASLLRRASGPTSGARYGEEAAVATVVGAIRSNHPRPAAARRTAAHTRVKALTAGVVAAFTLTGTLAAVDALPAPAQEVAADALAVVGVHVPSPSGSPATGREKPADVHAGHPGAPTLTTTATPASSGTSVPPVTRRAGVSASTTSVSVSSQPGAGAGRTQGPTGPATNPQSGAPQSAPAPTAGDDHPSAAPAPATTSSTPQRQASRRAPSSSSSPDDGTRAGPRRGGAGRTQGRTPQD